MNVGFLTIQHEERASSGRRLLQPPIGDGQLQKLASIKIALILQRRTNATELMSDLVTFGSSTIIHHSWFLVYRTLMMLSNSKIREM